LGTRMRLTTPALVEGAVRVGFLVVEVGFFWVVTGEIFT